MPFKIKIEINLTNINHNKSEIISINSTQDVIELFARMYGCKVGQWPCSYLGLISWTNQGLYLSGILLLRK